MNIKKINKLNFYPTINCNYNCWFCHRFNNEEMDLDENSIYQIIDFINKISENLRIDLSGGEATTSPYILNIIKNIKFNSMIIASNISFDQKLIENINDIIIEKKSILKITPTFHAQFADQNKFLEKILLLYKYNLLNSHINLTFEDISYEYILEKYYPIYKMIKEYLPTISIRTMSPNNQILDDKILQLFELKNKDNKFYYSDDNKIRYRHQNINPFINKNVQCYKETLCIYSNGNVYLCTSNISQRNIIKPLYNIFDKNAISKHNIYYNITDKCTSSWCCHC
jgi:organic radical activating enzyme